MGSGHPEAPLRSTSLTLTGWWILYTQTSFIHPLKHVGAASWSRAPPQDYPTFFKVVFYTEGVCQKIPHDPLVMFVAFFQQILRTLQEINT